MSEEKKVSPCGRGKEHKAHPDCNCGRSTKYTTDEDMIAKVDQYIESCVDTYDPDTKQRTVRLPKIASLALMLGVSKETINQWEKQYPKFSDATDKVRALQEEKLLDEGLAGNYNPMIAKLGLSANHGMREKTDVTTDDKPIEGIQVVFKKPE